MRAAGGSAFFKTVIAIYYISWIFIGNFILLNLFLAILIDSFGEVETEIEDEDTSERSLEQAHILHKKRIATEKMKRLKTLGASVSMKISPAKSGQKIKKKKKTANGFTGNKYRIDLENYDAVEDMDNRAVRGLLID